ncbi:MAG TPA: S8 family serine peptidase, partial [Ignavibacteriaceae bacterium]|nr:S8 family serine peptidase [Ignavibacteriaceae bacterium]
MPKIYLQKDFVDIELASYPGWTFDPNEDYVNIDDDATGLREHGTQVAQVAAATTNNAYGIAGVGWNTPLVLVRCGFQATNPQGTTVLGIEMDDIINAVNWIRTSSNAKILNISLGWTYSPSSILDAALTSCMNAGIVVVASAGNSSGAPVMYPAQYPGVIAVSGTNSDDINSHYCAGSQLSVVAPANGSWVNISGSISSGAGTSLAAPLVSGAIALLLSQNPNLTPALVKKIIEVTAVKVPGMNGQNFHNYYGYGLLDVYEALRATNSIYTFTNKVMSSGYGSLIIDNDKVNPVPTGSKVPFKYGTLHQSRTNELPFLVNYSGTTQKFNMWYGNNLTPDYNLQLSFTADNLTPAEKDANFIATAPVTIKNIFPEVGALNPANDNISFKDPWYFNKDNNNNWFQTNQY